MGNCYHSSLSCRGRREESKMEAGLPLFSLLPNEIISTIFKDLPIKDLLKFRCVCKEWNSIITGQSFINTHLLSQPQGTLFCHYFEPSDPSSSTSDKTELCFFLPDASFCPTHKFVVPLPYSSQLRVLVGSLDGLLCLTDSNPFGCELHLWNPTIRKCKTLSNSCLFNENDRQSFFRSEIKIAFGLGFRVHTSDRTIVRIVVFQSRSSKLTSDRLPQAEVYSLSTESWKKVEVSEDVSNRLMDIGSRQYVNLHGDLNWIATFSDGEGRPYKSILSFNVNNEEFREIRLPCECENGIGSICRWIEVDRGSLAMVISGKLIPDDGSKYVWLWVMEEYGNVDSWRKRTVKQMGAISLQGCNILDGRIMFRRRVYRGRRRVVLLDMETLKEQAFSVPNFLSVHAFKETLVSPGS